jgi:lipopolysaccharide export LptBFGC system permease protein LptF
VGKRTFECSDAKLGRQLEKGAETVYYIPICLTLLSVAFVIGGFHLSRRSCRPKLLRAGAVITAVGLLLLWVLPWWLFNRVTSEWTLPLFIAILFVSISVLGLGLQLIARACGAREQSQSDRLLDDFSRLNDLP